MREIHTGIRLIISVLEIVDPTILVGVDIDNVGIQEVPFARERSGDGLVDDTAFLIDIGGIFRDHDHLVRVDLDIGVTYPVGRIQLVFPESRRRIVVPLIFIDHLLGIEFLFTRHRVGIIDTLDRPQLILIGLFPGDRAAPVQVRRNGITITVFRDLEKVVASISGISQSLADDGVAYPIDELPVFGVRDFGLVHPERVKRDPFRLGHQPPKRILVRGAHLERAALDQYHAIRRRLVVGGQAGAGNLSSGVTE